MLKFKILLLPILLTVVVGFVLLESDVQQILWKINRPQAYYIEIADVRHGDTYRTTAIVSAGEIVYAEPRSAENNLSIFSIEQLFVLAQEACDFLQTDCSIVYDDEMHYISELAIYDWRVVRVTIFEPLPGIDQSVPLK